MFFITLTGCLRPNFQIISSNELRCNNTRWIVIIPCLRWCRHVRCLRRCVRSLVRITFSQTATAEALIRRSIVHRERRRKIIRISVKILYFSFLSANDYRVMIEKKDSRWSLSSLSCTWTDLFPTVNIYVGVFKNY